MHVRLELIHRGSRCSTYILMTMFLPVEKGMFLSKQEDDKILLYQPLSNNQVSQSDKMKKVIIHRSKCYNQFTSVPKMQNKVSEQEELFGSNLLWLQCHKLTQHISHQI